jgi:hypothetical protein
VTTQLPHCQPATLLCTPVNPCPTFHPHCPAPQQAQGTAATVCTQYGCPQQAQPQTATTVCTQHGCPQQVQGTAATVCTQYGCPQQAQGQTAATVCTQHGCHTHVQATNCPPATVCPQPTTLCGPQAYGQAVPQTSYSDCPQGGGPTPTATFYYGCHAQAYAQAGPQQVVTSYSDCPQGPGPTPTATYYYGCHAQAYPQVGGDPTLATVCTQFGCHPHTVTLATVCTQFCHTHPRLCPQAAAAPNTQLPQCQPQSTLCIQTVNFGNCPPQVAGGCYPYTGPGPVTFPPGCWQG